MSPKQPPPSRTKPFTRALLFERVSMTQLTYQSPCWLWKLKPSKDGFGRLLDEGKTKFAHRWVYEEWHRKALDKDTLVYQLCLHKLCVNPSHLNIRKR